MKSKQSRGPKSTSLNRKTGGKVPADLLAAKQDAERWKERCLQLEKECDLLRHRVTELRAQRAEYSQIICDYVLKDKVEVDFDEEAVLAQAGKGQPLEDLLAELGNEDGCDEIVGKKRTKRRVVRHGKNQ